jgi:hypothetical protein
MRPLPWPALALFAACRAPGPSALPIPDASADGPAPSAMPAPSQVDAARCPDGRPPVVAAPCPGKDLMEALHCPGRQCREGTVWDGRACVPPCDPPSPAVTNAPGGPPRFIRSGAASFGPIPDGPVTALEGGKEAMCGLRPDRTLICWGSAKDIVARVPGGAFTSASVGTWHACGLRDDGSIACWGRDYKGSLQAPTGTYVAVTADVASCALDPSRHARCWGVVRGRAPTAPLRAISSGGAFTCWLDQAGALGCFEADAFLFERSNQPPPRGNDFADVAAGYEHACAKRSSGEVVCWGRDVWGETEAPKGAFTKVVLGEKRTCGLRAGGEVVCWGGHPAAPPPGPFADLAITGNTAQDDPTFVCAAHAAGGGVVCWAY